MGQCSNIWYTIWLSSRRPLAVPRRSPPTAPILPWHATESGSTWYGPWFDNQKLFPPSEPLSLADGANMCSWATKLAAVPRRELREAAMAVEARRRLPGVVGTTRGLRPDHSAGSQSGPASCRRAPTRWTAPTIWAVWADCWWTGHLCTSGVLCSSARATCPAAHMLGHLFPAYHFIGGALPAMHRCLGRPTPALAAASGLPSLLAW